MKTHSPANPVSSRRVVLAILGVIMAALGAPAAEPIWAIGQPDGLSMEFAHGSRANLSYTIGQSVPSRDFAGSQSGSMDRAGKQVEKPYTIVFGLESPVHEPLELVMDLIFNTAAPRQLKITINDKIGIFPIEPLAMHTVWGDQGNEMLLAKQRLIVPIQRAWFKTKENKITIVPLGIGSMSYDSIALRRAEGRPSEVRFEPTIYYRKLGGKLVERCNLLFPFNRPFTNCTATISVGKQSATTTFSSGKYDFGVWVEPVDILPPEQPATALVELMCDSVTGAVSRHEFKPAKKWKLFVCPKVHNDVGYTDLQPHVNELDNRNSDQVLDLLRKYPSYKFNFETSWLVDNFLDCRTAPARNEFFSRLRQGRAALNAFYLNLMTGICTGEELYRAMYFTHRLHREKGGNFDFACITDAPSHSWFLPTLFHDVGIKGFANGANQSRAPILHYSGLNEDSPFYWEGMNGERIFMWYSRSYVQLKRLVGPGWGQDISSVEYLKGSVPQFLVRYQREDYAPDAVMIYGAYVDNAAIPETGEAETIAAWNREFEFPKLVLATDAEYFNYVEKHFAKKLPVHRGDCGAYWEDGAGSTAQATKLNRHTQQILPAAETAASLASLFEPRNRYPVQDFWNAWRNVMFYDEHTWGAHSSLTQPGRQFVERQWEIKEDYATRANLDARNLLARANNRLAQVVAVDGSSVLAWNWQNQSRTAPLEIELGSSEQLVDLANDQVMPMDIYGEQDHWRKVRFMAANVPAMGYKVYGIRSWNATAHKPNETLQGDTIENQFYRLVVDRRTGALKSLFDKSEQRELVDTNSGRGLNEYVYVSGGDGSLLLNANFGTAPAQLIMHKAELVGEIQIHKTPLGQRLVVQAKSQNTPTLTSEYLLYDALKRVDFVNTFEKVQTRAKEAVYFAFPFATAKPAVEYQIQNGWVRPNEDQMPGACREWFTPQNLVHVGDGSFSVAWATPDAPLVTLTDINRGLWLSHLAITNGHVFSYALNNYWYTNYRAQQGGRFTFRYYLTSGRHLNRSALARFDVDTRVPVVAYPHLASFSAAISQAGRPMAVAGGSFLSLDAPNLEFVTLKEAEDGDGFVLRFREIAGQGGEAKLRLPPLTVLGAWICNGMEENQRQLPVASNAVTVPYQRHAFTTVRLKMRTPEIKRPGSKQRDKTVRR